MKNVTIDEVKTLGKLYFLGSEPVQEYVDGKKTDRIKGYKYNLASEVQEGQVVVFVSGDKKEIGMMEPVKLIGLETKIYAKASGNFANVVYSLSAYDITKGEEML